MQLRRRPAARIILTDPLGRILLFYFDHRKGALTGSSYWATPGGGLEPGESFEQAAMRELQEETGFLVRNPGPIIEQRQIVLQLASGEHVLEDERYFHIAASTDQISLAGWDACELDCMRKYRWWTRSELEQALDPVSPENLLTILERIVF